MGNKKDNHLMSAIINCYADRALIEVMYRLTYAQKSGDKASIEAWQKIADAIEQQLMSHSLIESSVH